MFETLDLKIIDEFRGKYFFLSNFFVIPILYKGDWYVSSEHAFQAQKAINEKDRQYIQDARTPRIAKQRGNEIALRPNWRAIRMPKMYDILICKFTDNVLSKKLLETGGVLLIEGNSWGDRYWGMVRDKVTGEWKGDNFLGKLLMKVRNEIR